MQEMSYLAFIPNCSSRMKCISESNKGDVRTKEHEIFLCAKHSFCPELCCPMDRIHTWKDCFDSLSNPCFAINRPGKRKCVMEHHKNANFGAIRHGRLNVTCHCPGGMTYDSVVQMCVDIDECLLKKHHCEQST